MSVYDTLNDKQKEAVFHTEGPLLVLAGAGSGKTRVLTHRIAYLMEEKKVKPWNILAITFTNKAAGEMRERVDKLVGDAAGKVWVSTFHSACVRILRRDIGWIGFDTNFAIYDTEDQKSLMKSVCKQLQVDTKLYKERALMSAISAAKDELVSPQEFALRAQGNFRQETVARVYAEYQRQLKSSNALDFDDLIMKTVELFQANSDILNEYQERFRYIMVDEYQDTNTAQFKLVSLLAAKYRNLCVVGDDDQSIYKFRGANIQNILGFEKTFPDATVIKLEQNYRSTQNILNAANTVIAHNKGRKEKKLWTANGEGDKVRVRSFMSAYDEAEIIVGEIAAKVRNQDAQYEGKGVGQDFFPFPPSQLDESHYLEADYREDTRHDIEDDAADEHEEHDFPQAHQRRSGDGSGRFRGGFRSGGCCLGRSAAGIMLPSLPARWMAVRLVSGFPLSASGRLLG